MMGVPTLFLILIVQVILKPSIVNVMIVIGLTGWMGVARLVRAEVLSVKERPFVYAAKARGISKLRLVFFYILPHCINPIIVSGLLGMGGAILLESVLSFLGLGVQPPHASWGNMLDNSLSFMTTSPWMALFPGLMITLTVLSIQYLGDALRTRFNVQEKV
jgi:peptide/nickel transport system permease protein